MNVTIKQIQSFLAVAEYGNFSTASKRMNIAQPAISQAVKDLEQELSIRLFDRTTRRVELTDAGKEFADTTAKIMEELQLAIRSVHDLADRRRGKIRVAAPPLLAASVLPFAIAEFTSRYPGISVELNDVGTETIIESVRSGRADCGLGTFSPAEPGIERVVLVRDSLMLFSSTNNALSKKKSVSWADLQHEPIIALTRDSGIRLLVEVGFEMAQLPFNPTYEVTQITTAVALVEAGLGIAVLPSYALTAVNTRGGVVGKPLVEPSVSRDVVLIHATGRSTSPATSAFVSVVRRFAKKLSPNP